MTTAILFLILVAALFGGAAGWGGLVVATFRRLGWTEAENEIRLPIRISLGVSIFLAIGGILVACNAARPPVLLLWHVVGIAYLTRRSLSARRAGTNGFRTGLRHKAIVAAAGIIVFLMSLGLAIGVPFYNPPDDDPGYIYLAQRLVSTGGLLDPFNLRRFTSYGGSTLYQSMFLRMTGNASLRGFELSFGALLLLLLTIRTSRRRWLALFVLIVGIGVFLGQGIGPIINLSPVYTVAALSLCALQLLSRIRISGGPDQRFLLFSLGLVLSGILALRWMYVLPMAFAVFVVLAVQLRRGVFRALLLIAGTSVLCTVGWAVALYRSSGTPVPAGGNFNSSYPSGASPYVGLSQLPRKFWDAFSANGSAEIVSLSVIVAVVLLLRGTPQWKRVLVLLCFAIGCAFQAVAFTYLFSGSIAGDVERFFAPSVFACGLFAIDTFWPIRSRGVDAVSTPTIAPSREARRVWPPRPALVSAALAGALIVVTFGNLPGSMVQATSEQTRSGFHLEALGARVLVGSTGFGDRYSAFRADYAQLNALIPKGVKVLAAVERPALLDLSKFDAVTLDIPGAVSPIPHFPYFTGAAAKVAYLRHLGIAYIVSESPASAGLYHDWHAFLRSTSYFRRGYAAYFADWQSTVNALERNSHVRVVYRGSVALIDIQ